MTDAGGHYPTTTVVNFSMIDNSNRQPTEGNTDRDRPVLKAKKRKDQASLDRDQS